MTVKQQREMELKDDELIERGFSIEFVTMDHGFHNQKLFYQMLRDIYDCTPRAY